MTDTSPSPPQHARRITILAKVLIAVMSLSAMLAYLYFKRQSLQQNAEQDISRITTLLTEQTDRTFDSARILLQVTADKMGRKGYLDHSNEKPIYDTLKSYIAGAPHIRALTVTGPNGVVIASTFRYPTKRPDLSKRDYYIALKKSPSFKSVYGKPVQNPLLKDLWLLNVAEAILTPEGEFGGMVVVTLVPEYFMQFYQSINLPSGSYISLLNQQNIVMSTYPERQGVIGKVYETHNPNPQLTTTDNHYTFISQNRHNNALLMNACATSNANPLQVCTSTPLAPLMRSLNVEALIILTLTLGFNVVIMTLIGILRRHAKEREVINQELTHKNAILEKLSRTDYLTELPNRYELENRIHELIASRKRYHETFSLIMIDIDFFKRINDTYGHNSGDVVLKRLSHIISERIRGTDLAGRWGGEEFIILCPHTDLHHACVLADSIRARIAETHFDVPEGITASLGVAEHISTEGMKELIARADQMMYRAKQNGRNQAQPCAEIDLGCPAMTTAPQAPEDDHPPSAPVN